MNVFQVLVLAAIVALLAWSVHLGIRMANECDPCRRAIPCPCDGGALQ